MITNTLPPPAPLLGPHFRALSWHHRRALADLRRAQLLAAAALHVATYGDPLDYRTSAWSSHPQPPDEPLTLSRIRQPRKQGI